MDANELASSLPAVLAMVPDPRSPRGKRQPLPAILTLGVCAMFVGAHGRCAIYQWGRQPESEAISGMGSTRPATPAGQDQSHKTRVLAGTTFGEQITRFPISLARSRSFPSPATPNVSPVLTQPVICSPLQNNQVLSRFFRSRVGAGLPSPGGR